MNKFWLTVFYKVLYNHYAKKHNKGSARISAILCISMMLFFALINTYIIVCLITKIDLLPKSKVAIWLCAGLYLCIISLILAIYLKIEKPMNLVYSDINGRERNIVWITFFLLFTLVFTLSLLDKYW